MSIDKFRFDRRALLAATPPTVLAAAFIGPQALASATEAGCGCAVTPGRSAMALAANLQDSSANVPTPREQTVIIETHETNVYDSCNPFIPNGEAWLYGINQLCRESMFYANFLTGEIIPWLAESWEYNADFTELTLALNAAATWSDGKPFTSDDVLFSLEMMRAIPGLVNANVVIDNVGEITAPDAQTVVLALTSSLPRFHYNFIAGIVFDVLRVMPKHVWDGQDPNTFQNNPPIYTGSYVLDQIIPDQFMYVWKKSATYWNKAALDPKPEYVVFRQFLPTDAATQEIQRGNIDVANNDQIGYLNQQAILASYDQIVTFQFADPCPRAFHLNYESPSGLFKSPDGAWAISYLIDRELIGTAIWQPPSRPALFPWADYEGNARWSNAEVGEQYALTYDPAKAEERLAAAGAVKTDGAWTMNGEPISLTVVVPGGTTVQEYQIAQTLVDNAAEIGLEIVISALTFPAWTDALSLGQYDISCHWICGLALDPYQLYVQFNSENAKPIGENATAGNPTRTQFAELDAVIEQLAVLSPEDEANQAAFDEGLAVYMKHLPVIPSIQTLFPATFGTAFWTGWPTDEDQHNIPMYWWAQFLFVIGRLEPATQ